MLVTRQHRAVVEALAQWDFLVRAGGLIGEIIVTRIRDQQLQSALGFALDHAIRRNLGTLAYKSLVHRHRRFS
jgi:hypothetical protein